MISWSLGDSKFVVYCRIVELQNKMWLKKMFILGISVTV